MTADSEYMIKTVTKGECQTFLRILPGYFEHMRKYPESFITQFYGLHCIKIYGTTIYFTVMKNIFVSGLDPHEKYDIKGSWVSRHTNHHIESGKLMKDEDLHKRIIFTKETAHAKYMQMKHDTRFLKSVNIMDYSLLLGIYYVGIDSEYMKVNSEQIKLNSSSAAHYDPPSFNYYSAFEHGSVGSFDHLSPNKSPRTIQINFKNGGDKKVSSENDDGGDSSNNNNNSNNVNENEDNKESIKITTEELIKDELAQKAIKSHAISVRPGGFRKGAGLETLFEHRHTFETAVLWLIVFSYRCCLLFVVLVGCAARCFAFYFVLFVCFWDIDD